MPTWRLKLEYDGAAFSGWQFQPEGRTVQRELETALSRLFGGEAIRVNAAGRTDAGVHALGQVVSFRSVGERPPDGIRMALNGMLPWDISCVAADRVADSFHARMSATGKRYRYVVLHRRDRAALQRDRCYHIRWPLDWALIEEGLRLYLGTHNFSAFRGPSCEARNPVRTISRAEHLNPSPDEHWIEVEGPGFLRHQVRIMVGTVLEVGEGKRSLDALKSALTATDRSAAGRTAPPGGLSLVEVYYPPDAGLVPPSPESEPSSD